MKNDLKEFTWNLFTELRKELISLQRIRAQVIGFKITFVSTAIALIAANLDRVPRILFVVPGFAAVFFDLLIHSYSFSIKRTGFYCRNYLEPIFKSRYCFPPKHLLWEEFMSRKEAGKNVSFWGSLGTTLLALAPAVFSLFSPFVWYISIPLLIALIALAIYDVFALYKPNIFTN